MSLSKSAVLEMLSRLRSRESISALRAEIPGLQTLLAGGEQGQPEVVTAPEDKSDSVVLSRPHLLEDLQQIGESQTLERASHYLDRLQKGIMEVRTGEVNDINFNRWKEYDDILTDSLWIVERRDNSGAHSSEYWGNFIPQIPNQLIRRYTKKGEWVLDTFLGCGTTLIESQRLGRHGIGIELQPSVAAKAREAIASEPNAHGVTSQVVEGDSATASYQSLLRQHGQERVQLVIMHPPYFDIIRFSEDPRDLSNASSVEGFLQMLTRVVQNAAAVLEPGRYLGLVIGDKYARGEWIPLGFLAMNEILKSGGFTLKSIVVKNFEGTTGKRQQKELWRYRALVGGFYVFKHEYVFVFTRR